MLIGRQMTAFFSDPDYWYIDQVIESGDLPRHEKVDHPARHFFEAKELRALLDNNGFSAVKLGGSPCISCGHQANLDEISKNNEALKTIINIELETYTKDTMVDNGEFFVGDGEKINLMLKSNGGLTLLECRKYVSQQIESQIWGSSYVDELALFIAENHPEIKGFNRRGIYRMKQFYETYNENEFVSTLLTQIDIFSGPELDQTYPDGNIVSIID